MSMTFDTSLSGSIPGILTTELCFPRQRFSFPSVKSYSQATMRHVVKCWPWQQEACWAIGRTLTRSHPGEGWISAEKRGTSLEPDHDGSESRKGDDAATLTIRRLTFLLKREKREIQLRRGDGKRRFHPLRTGIHYPFIQETFIQYLLYVRHDAGAWKRKYQTGKSWIPFKRRTQMGSREICKQVKKDVYCTPFCESPENNTKE